MKPLESQVGLDDLEFASQSGAAIKSQPTLALGNPAPRKMKKDLV